MTPGETMQISTEFINRLAPEIARSQLQQQISASARRIARINPRFGEQGARQAIEDLFVENLAQLFLEPSEATQEAAQQPSGASLLNRHERRHLAALLRKHRI
jgi:hypothetical protein